MPNTEVHREWRRSVDVERRASSMKQLNFDAVASPQPKQGASASYPYATDFAGQCRQSVTYLQNGQSMLLGLSG